MNRKQAQSRARAAVLILIPAILAIASCSTFNSDYYMHPRDGGGVKIQKGEWADYAEIRMPDFTFLVRVPVSGSTRHCLGPVLLPFIPTTREWPQPLRLEIVIAPGKPGAKVRVEPGKWIAHTRAEEFGKTFGKNLFKDVRPIRAAFFKGTGPRTLKSENLGVWTFKGKVAAAQQADFRFTGGTRAMISFPPYDNSFIDFELRDVRVEIDGKTHDIPSIQFKRKSRWKYTPWTLRVFDM